MENKRKNDEKIRKLFKRANIYTIRVPERTGKENGMEKIIKRIRKSPQS